jgi:uncharacterized protein (TIGR03435 family)
MFPQIMPAQSLAGIWQGNLTAPNGQTLRIQMRVSTTDADGLKALMYSIDQTPQPFPSGAITSQNGSVKITVPGIGGTWEGKFSPDGASLTGTWTQGPMPSPLNLARVTEQAAWEIPKPPPPVKPMAPDANPSFEVATIKPSRPDARGKGIGVPPGGRRINTLNTTVADLMTFAYGIHVRQIVGAPAWIESEKYDLTGQPDAEGQPNDKQWKLMIQKVLADRFQLAFHRDKKELSVYALTAGKNGAKLTKSTGDPNGLPGLGFRRLGGLAARNATMSDFTGLLQGTVLDRPVIDQTSIMGRYDFTLDWTPDEFQFTAFANANLPPQPKDDVAPNPDLYTAIQQQLGLKLESTKAATEVFVIDKVEKPTEN